MAISQQKIETTWQELYCLSRETLAARLAVGVNHGPRAISLNIEEIDLDGREMAQIVLATKYLERIGFEAGRAIEIILGHGGRDESLIRELHRAHVLTFPFENLSLFDHAATSNEHFKVPRDDPTLNVAHSLYKLIVKQRGGFCWELNFCWLWLLRSLGFKCRLGNSYVNLSTPGHCLVFVDLDMSHLQQSLTKTLLVDVGFSNGIQIPVPTDGRWVTDSETGDSYQVIPNNSGKKLIEIFPQSNTLASERFDSVLIRQRKSGRRGDHHIPLDNIESTEGILMDHPSTTYYLNTQDDLEWNHRELTLGLGSILVDNESNLFTQKPLCLQQVQTGYQYLGRCYFKKVEFGNVTERFNIENDKHFRTVLRERFGIVLEAEMNPKRTRSEVAAYQRGKAVCKLVMPNRNVYARLSISIAWAASVIYIVSKITFF